MKFIDTTSVLAKAGKGGDGMVSFRRARNKPKLGPDGGDGGGGGHVILKARASLNTLSHIQYKSSWVAEHGSKGGANNCKGARGSNCVIDVPLGTVAYGTELASPLGELIHDGDELVIATGGKHGRGNLSFTSSVRRAPYFHTLGLTGESQEVRLELKLLADVGLVGYPNAGKSTLISRMTAAKPKIADYPFTTLKPCLGVVKSPSTPLESFVIADIPGLIDGASEGKGLGTRFLKHLERNSTLLFLVDPIEQSPQGIHKQYNSLLHELKSHAVSLGRKKHMVALTKADSCVGFEQPIAEAKERFKNMGIECISISSVTGFGLDTLKHSLATMISNEREAMLEQPEEVAYIKYETVLPEETLNP